MPQKVAIIGGGVNGLATGIRLQKAVPQIHVQIIAELLGDDTTSRGDTPSTDVIKWGEATFQHMLKLCQSPAASAAGMQLVDAYQLWDKPMEEPFWKEIVPFFQQLSRRELDMFPGHPWTHGWKYTTVICDSQLYMQYLHKQFTQAGGSMQQRKINDLSEIAQEFELVVNCAGLGSKELFKDDKLTAVRGQVIRVRAPWIKNYMNNNGQFYIIPNFETVVLGGTTQKGNYDTTINPEDRERIMEGCCKMVPSLRHAEVVSDWAGLRPARDRVLVTLEHQQVTTVDGQVKSLPVVHNYGHGGAGITLHWGCAADAVHLVEQHLEQSHISKL